MKKKKIVAIDDVGDVLELIEYNLSREGMEVVSFSSSKEALDYILQFPPDLVVSDWMMPAPDGLEVCREIKEYAHTSGIPVIMLTCKATLEDYKQAIDAGAQDYIAKPVRMDELIRRIKLLLPHNIQRFHFT